MQTLTAKAFTRMSILADLKDICGSDFNRATPTLRLTMLATLTQFQLFKSLNLPNPAEELMEEAMDSVPALAWLGHSEVRARLLKCWQLDDDAIAHLIQQLAENL